MSNEMKLLRAFIEASSYEIEEITSRETHTVWVGMGVVTIPASIDYKVTNKEETVSLYALADVQKFRFRMSKLNTYNKHNFGESIL